MKEWLVFKLKDNLDCDVTCKNWFITLIHPLILLLAGILFTIILPISLIWLLIKQFTKQKETEVENEK